MSEIAWKNGQLLSFDLAGLDKNGWPSDSGIFETIKTVDGVPWAFSRHMRRALSSARRLDLNFPRESLIRSAVDAVIAANNHPIGRLRVHFSSLGDLILTHQRYEEIAGSAKLTTQQISVDFGKLIEKRYPYTANLNLLALAKTSGFDDLILINQRGEVTESSVANFLFQVGQDWITPPLSSGVLPGVLRGLLIEKIGVRVKTIMSSDLPDVRSGFLLSSLKIAQPIGQIEERILTISEESEQMRVKIAATALATSVG